MSTAFKREKAVDPAEFRLPRFVEEQPIVDSKILEAGQLDAIEANDTQHADERDVIG